MRRPTFWEIFWFLALVTAPIVSGAVGVALRFWLGLPKWIAVVSPFIGWPLLFGFVWVLVRLDDRRASRAEQIAQADRRPPN